MAFDQTTRNRLQRFVNEARRTLEEEFTRQLQNDYGLDPVSGAVTPIDSLRHLNDAQRETARILRDTLAHYCAAEHVETQAGLDRIVREQAFTVLNRLAALRMAEARGLLIESVGNGYQAKGFQLYARLAGTGLGETGDAYRVYLFSVFDELAQDLPSLFDRYSPQGRLFPREAALLAVLTLINDPEIEPLWAEDETIGWIYQYFNSKEERKAMRDASQAPRNSRELAVRNQFFTPRYVVEFLVDNTLGRLWFNATGGQTALRERCQYLLVKPDEQPQATVRLRDPRTLKLLDPACGSMHFGLYAFDLFLEIYREAWAWEQQHGPGSLDVSTQPAADLKPLCQTYLDEAAFLRDVPRLVIEQNIYGVDIDPRAAQIATLALWLRAQRAWHDVRIQAKDRPAIGHGHVLAAVAPPAERELRQQIAAELDHLDAELFEKTLQLLKSLPELGVLLQVERELPHLIREVYGEHGPMFKEADMEQWHKAEGRLREALTEFAQAAKSTYQGRLFAQDALQGLRLIDLIREQFDVTVMNPPFGAPTGNTYDYIRNSYSGFHNDIYASFVARASRLSPSGYVGCISSRSFLMSPRLEQFRRLVILPRLISLSDFGLGVMDDAHVEAAAYVLGPDTDADFSVIDIRKIAAEREVALLSAIANRDACFLKREWFLALPQAKILYVAPRQVRELLASGVYFEPAAGTAREGMKSFDNFRFIRLWWEVEPRTIGRGLKWERFSKGGDFSYFYLDTYLLLNWANDGAELKEINRRLNGSTAQVRQASDYWYTAGVTYSKRSAKGFSARVLPKDTIFTSNGPAVLSTSDVSPLYLLGWINSRLIRGFIHLQSNFGDYSTGSLKRLPWVTPHDQVIARIEESARAAVKASLRARIGFHETSPRYVGPILCETFLATTASLGELNRDREKAHQCAIAVASDLLCEEYEIDDLTWVDDLLGGVIDPDDIGEEGADRDDEAADSELVSEDMVAFALLSYWVGCLFGRWDFREHISRIQARKDVDIPDAFTSIPQCPPGQAGSCSESLECAHLAKQYPNIVELHGISESTVNAENRLVARVRYLLDECFGETSAAWEDDLCASLRVAQLADYIHKPSGFFARHLAQYSLSGRQAPIFWPLSTTSGDYTLWIYYPRLDGQTLYTAVNDFVEPKLKQVSEAAGQLRNKGAGRSRGEEKQFEELQAFELELIELRDTLLKLAPTYKPNHDDGVQICAAPLWPLFRHKPWQKVLKDTWEKLKKGDYDWAHLAMNYWPDRVREKCKTDKSLAIAHGLEDLYIEPPAKPKTARGRKKKGG